MYSYVGNNPTTLNDPGGLQQGSKVATVCGSPHADVCTEKERKSLHESSLQALPINRNGRLKQALEGAGKVLLGVGLVATIAGGDVPGGVAGAVLLSNAALSSTALTVSGTVDLAGAATNTDTSKSDKALEATGNLGGLTVTAASGNLEAGHVATTATDVGALAVNPMDATRSVATTVDAGRTVLRGGQLVGRYWQDIKRAFVHALNNPIGPIY